MAYHDSPAKYTKSKPWLFECGNGDISRDKIIKDLKLQYNEFTVYFDPMGIPSNFQWGHVLENQSPCSLVNGLKTKGMNTTYETNEVI